MGDLRCLLDQLRQVLRERAGTGQVNATRALDLLGQRVRLQRRDRRLAERGQRVAELSSRSGVIDALSSTMDGIWTSRVARVHTGTGSSACSVMRLSVLLWGWTECNRHIRQDGRIV